ncbi:MAG: copper-translocating P-type ATPase [Alphaproteobacteria bacterium]|nr:copper-translocating P-type ATPase [Alphaproteobacteria bacterium]
MTAQAAGCPRRLSPANVNSLVQDPAAFVTQRGSRKALDILVTGASCAGCLSRIEGAVSVLPGVSAARLNLSTGRLHVDWSGPLPPRSIIEAVVKLGYGAAAYDPGDAGASQTRTERQLIVALAVAGFAVGNVMLLSVSIWAGADMSAETRTLLHWISALIAIPAALFSGMPFFRSAVASVQARNLNMDVPISLAVLLALALSLFETATGGVHAYFDASVTLLFFLLIGRVLDAHLRRRAYAAANALAAAQSATATRLGPNGAEAVRVSEVRPGDVLMLAAGDRLGVDATVVSGASDVDLRLVTGEVEPVAAWPGQVLHAGAVNGSGQLRVRALATADRSLTAEIARLLEAGEQKKSSYRRIADRAAAAYVPMVHTAAALGFAGWLLMGADLPQAFFVAVSVLIITCPCALALAAPMVQVVAAGRLFREGAYLASGDALERIAAVDHVVFDKTGTMTLGDPVLSHDFEDAAVLKSAAQLARASRHPFSRALVHAAGVGPVAEDVVETSGAGVAGLVDGRMARLGSAAFLGVKATGRSRLWFGFDGQAPVSFHFDEKLRPETKATIARLRDMGITAELLSGDEPERVRRAAEAAGIQEWTASADPVAKFTRLKDLEAAGRKVLMVGDGLNDAAALAGAHASLAPGGAVDVSRLAADCIFSGDSLAAVLRIIEVARTARARMRENFVFAAAYNVVAVPVALAGLATPILAAIAMSGSSALVSLNALRLFRFGKLEGRAT